MYIYYKNEALLARAAKKRGYLQYMLAKKNLNLPRYVYIEGKVGGRSSIKHIYFYFIDIYTYFIL